MIKKRKNILLAGAAVVLAGIIAASFILVKLRHSGDKGSQEVTTARKEETGEDGKTEERRAEPEKQKEVMDVHGIGHLYYLDPEAEQTFKEGLTAFLKTAGIKASSARVLEDHVDDRSNEKEPAVFYIKLNDADGTLVQVFFEKTNGRYGFTVSGPGVKMDASDDEDREAGRTEHEIPESSEDEYVQEIPVTITDTDDVLSGTLDEEQLKFALAKYLRSIDEGRRDLYVSSFRTTEKGYEAVLDFETVRHDGRNVEVRYDGTFHFRLV